MCSRFVKLAVTASCLLTMAFLLFAGCGSAGLDEYEQEVTALNEIAAEKMAEVSEALGGGEESHGEEDAHQAEETHEEDGSHEAEASHDEEESHDTGEAHEEDGSHAAEGEGLEAMVLALEEAISTLQTVILELEDVKVPGGREDFHRSLLAFYQSNLHAYEALLATLEPGEGEAAHGGEEAAEHEEEGGESHEEEETHEEEAANGGH